MTNKLNSESGATLIVSLIMLLLLTIIGITGASNVSLVERITGNISDKAETRQICEMGLRQAELSLAVLQGTAPTPSTNATNASLVWALGTAGGSASSLDSSWMSTTWPSSTFTASNTSGTTYFIEHETFVPDKLNQNNDYAAGGIVGTHYYRVSADTVSTRVASTLCQSTYAKRFN